MDIACASLQVDRCIVPHVLREDHFGQLCHSHESALDGIQNNAPVVLTVSCRLFQVPNATDSMTEPGCGVTATVEGSTVAVGRLDWLQQQEQIQPSSDASSSSSSGGSSDRSHQAGQSVVYVGMEGQGVVGSLGFSDTLREDAQHVVQQLQSMGIHVMLISGISPPPFRPPKCKPPLYAVTPFMSSWTQVAALLIFTLQCLFIPHAASTVYVVARRAQLQRRLYKASQSDKGKPACTFTCSCCISSQQHTALCQAAKLRA